DAGIDRGEPEQQQPRRPAVDDAADRAAAARSAAARLPDLSLLDIPGRLPQPGSRAMRRREAGFTLTEMMVVVTIIGVLVTMAIVYMRGHVRPIDVANRVGDLSREASRRAVALGPVRANVAVALGTKARTAITATMTSAGTPVVHTVVFTLWRLQ